MGQIPSTVNQMSLPLGVQIFLTMVLSLIICVAIIGNSMVCLAISRSRTLRSQEANVFIANLAITDLGCASLVMPFSLVSVWFDHWVFGSFLCDVACFFNYCFIIVSMLSLALISVDRHIYVVHPFRYQEMMTHRRAIVLVICTWIVGIIFAAAPPIMRWVIFDNSEIICAVNWESGHNQILAYTSSAFVICFMSPVFVMVYCYVGIYRVAKKHLKRIAPPQIVGRIGEIEQPEQRPERCGSIGSIYTQREASSNNGKTTTLAPQHAQRQGNFARNKNQGLFSNKAIRSILVMILAYLLCNTPFSLTKLIKVIKISNEAVPFYVNTAAAWIGFINPCCNPIIYSILREDFRNAFIKLLPRAIGRRLHNDMDGNTIRSQIIGNSPRLNARIGSNVTVNIINPSEPSKRSPALIANPLNHDDDGGGDYLTVNINSNVNNAVEATELVENPGRHSQTSSCVVDHIHDPRPLTIKSVPLVSQELCLTSDDEGYTGSLETSKRVSDDSSNCSTTIRRSSTVSEPLTRLHDAQSLTTTVSV